MASAVTRRSSEHQMGGELSPTDQDHKAEQARRAAHRRDADRAQRQRDRGHPGRRREISPARDVSRDSEADSHDSRHRSPRCPQDGTDEEVVHGPILSHWLVDS
jgi:hypothetical protein